MRRPTYTALVAATALCLSFASPAAAQGKADRARTAIAEAQTKIDTAEALGTSTAQPGQTAEANAALARAKENLAAGHKPEAIEDAIRASALADTALGLMQKNAKLHNEAIQAQSQAQAQVQADGIVRAQMNVDAAHQQTDMANDRAVRAENAAAASANDAAAARSAMAAQPTVVETTVTTQEAAAPVVVRKVVAAKAKRPLRRVVHHRRAVHRAVPAKVTTTTTVTQTTP